jgi:hypothetical protein
MMTEPTQYELADPGMISARAFDDEIIIANFSNGIYYSLRYAAAEIWLGLMAGVPADRVVLAMTPHGKPSPEAFSARSWTFIGALEDERLIRPASRPVDDSWRPRLADAPFAVPAFERFTDMEDLLLLDPIHDVGKTGWPDLLRKAPD